MSDVSEKQSRRRQRVVMVGAICLITGAAAAVNAFSDMAPGAAWRGVDFVRVGGLLGLSLVLAIRSTTAFSLFGRNPALDDEFTRANRYAAARFGFWVLMLGAIACLAASMLNVAITMQKALFAVIAVDALCTAIRFSILERRGDA